MIAIILAGAGFIIMPLVFIYFLAIKPIIKYARCSESVDGKITHIEKTVDYSSRGIGGSNVFDMVTCEYYYGGEKYVSEVKAYGRKFNASEGENISFFINPKNPLEAHMRI